MLNMRCWIRRCWLTDAKSVPVHKLLWLNLTGQWPSVGNAVQSLFKCTTYDLKTKINRQLSVQDSPWALVHPSPFDLSPVIQSSEDLIKRNPLSDWLIKSVSAAAVKVFLTAACWKCKETLMWVQTQARNLCRSSDRPLWDPTFDTPFMQH